MELTTNENSSSTYFNLLVNFSKKISVLIQKNVNLCSKFIFQGSHFDY
jgi:hypothetical protein